ncbi:hypothetical protein FGG08_003788 [Glutinoglossum americanum]|uniref:Septin-type G domain-containing protein n=1 Tax=Glutinoglossum americanum TaxID=1670608 RepID=A0A9P8L3C2_9PEZI|nr:hypothetical protein FGG08_003788 [Glutinoglossum americanum]
MAPTTSESASPIGIANLPNQRHKIVAKRGAAFTIMVAGESGLGKTTFINTLFSTTIKNYADHKRRHAKQIDKTVEIEITKAELEEKFFKVRLTVIDTPGFGDYVNNRDSWMPIIEFLDDQHESYMLQEQQPRRVDKIDLRVHACLYFIRPTGHTLKPLDIEVMKRLSSRVNLIPVVAKADTLSPADLARFKQRIRAVVDAQGIKIYQPPVEEDDENAAQHARSLMAAMPFAVIGSEKDVKTTDGRIVKGRQYSWGVAEVENEDHCDFKKLRSILIRTHMLDLIHTTEEQHYEAYRAQQMETRKFGEARPRKLDNPKFKEEEESLRKRFTEQVKIEEQRFRQWEQKLISERDRLNKDLESTHAAIKNLEQELEQMQGSIARSHGPVHCVTYSSGLGQYALSGGQDRKILLHNPSNGNLVQTYDAHGYEVLDLAVASDNARFASVGGDKQAFLWDVATARTVRRFAGHFSRIDACAFNWDASVLATGSFDATVRLWDCKSQSTKPIQVLEEAKDSVSSVDIQGHEIVTGSVDGKLRLYDLRMGQVHVDLIGHPVTSVIHTSDSTAVLTSTLDSTIRLFDKPTGSLLQSYKSHRNTDYRIRSCLGVGDAYVVSGSEDGCIYAWDLLSGKVVAKLEGGAGKGKVVSAVAFHRTQKSFLSAGADGTVAVWGMP